MVISREKKIQKLDSIAQSINSFRAVLCITYTNFVTEKIENLRDDFFKDGCKVMFAKNSLVSLACNEDSKDKMSDKLKTSNMLVFSNDIFSLISIVNNFVKSLKKDFRKPLTRRHCNCLCELLFWKVNELLRFWAGIFAFIALLSDTVSICEITVSSILLVGSNPSPTNFSIFNIKKQTLEIKNRLSFTL